jgi:hypothetical protein
MSVHPQYEVWHVFHPISGHWKGGRDALARGLTVGAPLHIVRVYDNEADPYALQITTSTGGDLGWVARDTKDDMPHFLSAAWHNQGSWLSILPGVNGPMGWVKTTFSRHV